MTEPEIRQILRLPPHDDLQQHGDLWILTASNGKTFSFTLRRKTIASLHRKTGRREFGIPLIQARRYRQYPALLLLVWESSTATLWVGRFADLEKRGRIYATDKVDKGGTLFVGRDDMKELVRQGATNG